MRNLIILIFFVCLSYFTFAQKERSLVRKGNNLYEKKEYVEAEVKYKKALEKKHNLIEASFNLGDALYKQRRYDSAAKLFELSANLSNDKMFKSKSYHNLGNSLLEGFKNDNDPSTKSQKIDQSIVAYKNALKQYPQDMDTKYNLSYALNLKQQQQQQQQKNDKNEDKDQKDQQQQNKQDQKQKQDQEQSQPQKQELSKEDAERLLKALQNEEKKVQKKLMKKKAEIVKVKIEKDW